MPTWPQFASIEVTDITTHHRDRKSTVLVKTNMHTGTHIDAPLHYSETGQTPGRDSAAPTWSAAGWSSTCARSPNSGRTIRSTTCSSMLPPGEQIRAGDIVVLYTGWDQYNWTKPTRDDVMYFDRHPGPQPEVIDYLIDEKKIKWIGADLASMDHSLYVRVRWHAARPGARVRAHDRATDRRDACPSATSNTCTTAPRAATCACSRTWAASWPTWLARG